MVKRKAPLPTSVAAIADRLRQTREAHGLQQAAWCRLVGIQPQAWNNYERGVNRISVDQALQLCRATGITLDWIYQGNMTSSVPAELRENIHAVQAGRPIRAAS